MNSMVVKNAHLLNDEERLLVTGAFDRNFPQAGAGVTVVVDSVRVSMVVAGAGNQGGDLLLSLELLDKKDWRVTERVMSASIASSQVMMVEFT